MIFCIDFGVDLGSFLGQKFDNFQRLLAFITGYDFSCDYVNFGASLCAPRCPKMTFLLQKNNYFHGSACFSKVVGIITDFMDIYGFLSIFGTSFGVFMLTFTL